MTVALQMAALAALMLALGVVVRFGQIRLRASYLAGRVAASIAGIILLPLLLQMLGARLISEPRVYVMGGALGFVGYWLAVKLWPYLGRAGRRRR
jgi:hypothetical protein